MKRPPRILAIAGTVLVVLLVLLLVLPYLFRGTIERRAKTAANENLNARVEWRSLGLGFFRNFPNLTLSLDGLTTVGVGKFQGDTLAAVRHLRVVLDLASVLGNVTGGKPIVVRAVELDQPRLRLIALEDGSANWDITKKTPAQAETKASKPMVISLKRFTIKDAAVAYDDAQAKLKARVIGFNQSLSGDLSQTLVAIKTRADADTVSVTFAGIPYLNRVQLGLTADVLADLGKKSYTLKDTELRLNDLKLGVTGRVATLGKDSKGGSMLGLDLAFNAPSTNFRSILSLVPAVYAHDFDKVKTSGAIVVKAQVKGEYGDNAFPSLALAATVENAAFQYPDLPLPARDIALDLSITNPGGKADNTVVNLRKFHLLIGRNPIDATLVLKTPLSDPDVDARVSGKVDLADVRRTVKLEGIDQLTGTVAADAAVKTRMSFIDKKEYGRVAASGTVDVASFTVKGQSLPKPLTIQQASLRLAPQRAELKSFTGSIGSSDLEASGTIDNLLGYMLRDDTLSGAATVRSNRFNLDEWKSSDSELEIIPVPPKIDFGLDVTVAELSYDKLKMTNARGRLRLKNQRVTLEDFQMNTLGGGIAVTGFYETTNPTKPTFDVGLKMTKVDIPSAFEAFTTVQMMAPVAKYAKGNVSTDMHLNGALGKNMMPLFEALTGQGKMQTSQLLLSDFPPMEKIVDVTKLQFLDNPTLKALWATFRIQDGRLFVEPFDVKVGETTINVAGSNGLDQSLAYNLGLKVPRSMLGGAANQAISGLVSKAGNLGVDLANAPEIGLGIQLGGTVKSPTIKADVSSAASSVTQTATQAVTQAVTQKVDSAAMRLVAEAEQKAATIRKDAQTLADKVKREGYQQADSLTAKASSPLERLAAKPAADQLRKQADSRAADIVSTANKQADDLVAQARRQADASAGQK